MKGVKSSSISERLVIGILLVVILFPLCLLLVWSFTARWPWPNLLPERFSLRGWQQLQMESTSLLAVLRNNIFISLSVSFLSIVIALLTAKVYVGQSKSIQKLIRFLVVLPLLIPATVFGMGIHPAFIRLGFANTSVGVILSHLIYSLPYAALLILNAYSGQIPKLEEEAHVLGASAWRTTVTITLPLLSPVLLVAFVMSYIVSFSQYFLTQLIGGGMVQTLATKIFPYLQANDRTIASVYSLVFLILTVALFALVEMGVKRYQQRHA
ncbi:MAG: ABC transporter permease subunit [Aerococcus sp.]|nr:ABC transporter permease subunit [Aerococcus sp.]